MSNEARPLTADDLVGILIHRANQMGSHLGVHGVNAQWDAMIAHLGSMYADVVRAKELMQGPPAMSSHEQAANPSAQPN